MRTEAACALIRPDLSALLDEELDDSTRARVDDHIRTCAECRELLARLERTRRVLRARPAEAVPDLSKKIVARVRVGDHRRAEWKTLARIAAAAAVIAAVVVATSWPRDDRLPSIAQASEVSAGLQRAAPILSSYRARYSIVEWNNPAGGTRRLNAEMTYSAPEKVRLEVDEVEASAGAIPNDFTLVANARAWSIDEAGSPPTTTIHRRPFDGTISVPTDLILPLESLADTEAFQVMGRETLGGFNTYRVRLRYANALPLVEGLQAGGSWRPFHPTDRVELWLERDTWFPVRFDVYAGSSRDRAMWASRAGLSDAPGDRLLQVEAQDFEQPSDIAAPEFRVNQRGIVSDSGYEPAPFEKFLRRIPGLQIPDSLDPYRAGTVAGNRAIATYAGGMSWVKVDARPASGFQSVLASAPEEITLGPGRWAYYLPASEPAQRRVIILGRGRVITLEGNLPRAELLEVAGTAAVAGVKAPRLLDGRGQTIKRFLGNADPGPLGFATPRWLPSGYELSSSYVMKDERTKTLTSFYRRSESELEGSGIRIVQNQGRADELLPPTSDRSIALSDGSRWIPDRGELELIADGRYTSITVPSRDLSVATKISESLR